MGRTDDNTSAVCSPVGVLLADEGRAVLAVGERFVPDNVPQEGDVVAHALHDVFFNNKTKQTDGQTRARQRSHQRCILLIQIIAAR